MKTSINVMGTQLDIISTEKLRECVTEYLGNDYLNIVFLASTKMLETASEDEEYREKIESANLLLPGNETLLSLHHADILKTGGMIVNYRSLLQMFDDMITEDIAVYLISRNEKECNIFREYSESAYPNLKFLGTYWKDVTEKEDVVVNEINSVAPDILLFAMDSPLQENWIMANSSKLNSKLCIGLGNSIDDIMEDFKDVPDIVKKMNLESFYRKLKKSKIIKKTREVRIFRKRVAHYKNKKGGSKSGDH